MQTNVLHDHINFLRLEHLGDFFGFGEANAEGEVAVCEQDWDAQMHVTYLCTSNV